MRLLDYLRSRGESQAAFARRAGVPQSTVNEICNGKSTRVETASKVIRASREEPTLEGETVTLEDLAEPEAA